MPKRILVVDDEPDILKIVTFRLGKLGYRMLTAVNGQEAFNLAQREKPDLILLDLRLPVIDGYEVCKRLKTDSELKRIPVILLTASSASKIIERTREFKADGYLIKPFEPEDLVKIVKKFIE